MSIKKISFLLVILIFSMFNVQNAQASITFTDLSSSHPAYGEIQYLIELGVLEGSIENGKRVFKPSDSVTRGQAAKMVVVATGEKPLVVKKSSFSDIDLKKSAALSGYVERAVELGYFSEYSPGKFAPKTPLTRNEMSKVLATAFQLNIEQTEKLPLPFNDVAASDTYYKYIAAIYYNGITNGTANATKYSAKDAVTRAQFSSFVARASSEKYRLDLPIQEWKVPNESDAISKVFVSVDNLNVRSSASSVNATNILGKVNTGKELSVFEEQGYWLKVAYNGQFAFVAKEYTKTEQELVEEEPKKPTEIKPEKPVEEIPKEPSEVQPDTPEVPTEEMPEQPTEQPIEIPTTDTETIAIATVNGLNIRESDAASATSLGKIDRGTSVNVLSFAGHWVEIDYQGTVGYVDKRFVRLKNTMANPVKDRVIIIDPGHGGKDPGTMSGQAVEKSIVFKVSQLVKQKLEADGANVKMTRTGDTYPTLDERHKFATNQYGEMFVSIHANSATNASAKGTETYYSVTSNENEKEDVVLATNINNEIVKNVGTSNRGVKRADFVVIKNLKIPAVLLELGFVSNAEDRAKLLSDQYIESFAQSIYNGIVEYYGRN
ncbi:N-acetylmuramoyl-L-alanine amidase [Solibacillus sp. FSL K6-1523]|uniref:N-acetylmuramoyl-L-alanine amidase n=1 Tax=Solibacillus sp. FSL K6-1523 TaxID=2921471 RepID=UPI0030F80CF4